MSARNLPKHEEGWEETERMKFITLSAHMNIWDVGQLTAKLLLFFR